MKLAKKILSYFLALILVAGAIFCLMILERVMPDGKNDLYVSEINDRNTAEEIDVSKPEAELLTETFGEWDDYDDSVPIREYDFIRNYVDVYVRSLNAPDFQPLEDELPLSGHVFENVRTGDIFISGVVYESAKKGMMRLDMCMRFDNSTRNKLSLSYYHCAPTDTSELTETVKTDVDYLAPAGNNAIINIQNYGRKSGLLISEEMVKEGSGTDQDIYFIFYDENTLSVTSDKVNSSETDADDRDFAEAVEWIESEEYEWLVRAMELRLCDFINGYSDAVKKQEGYLPYNDYWRFEEYMIELYPDIIIKGTPIGKEICYSFYEEGEEEGILLCSLFFNCTTGYFDGIYIS